MKICQVAAILGATIVSVAASGAGVTTEIGREKLQNQGSVTAAVQEASGEKRVIIFVSDRHAVQGIYFNVRPEQAKKIRDLLDEAIVRAEAQ